MYSEQEHGLCAPCADALVWDDLGTFKAIKNKVARMEHCRTNPACPFCRLVSACLPSGYHEPQIYIKEEASVLSKIQVFGIEKDSSFEGDTCSYGRLMTSTSPEELPPPSDDHSKLLNIDPILSALDFERLRRIISACGKAKCQRMDQDSRRYSKSLPIQLIDVEQMCLVNSSTQQEYVALSYVWGGISGIQSCAFNRDMFMKPGFLAECKSEIPLLVQDAIDLVCKLGHRYLWTDQLCLEQDSTSKKHESIQQMDIIYRCSSFTIVALASTKASDALAGVRPGTLAPSSFSVEKIGKTYFRPVIDLSELPMLSQSVYASRGWTFQEQLVSARCLYLTGFSALYQCKRGHSDMLWNSIKLSNSWIEWGDKDLNLSEEWELQQYNSKVRQLTDFAQLSTFEASPMELSDLLFEKWAYYQRLVKNYTSRTLSFPSDALVAFAGVFASTSGGNLGHSFYGLPEKFLYGSLFWTPSSAQGSLVRNKHFPSWAWVGWSGSVSYTSTAGHSFLRSTSWSSSVALRTSSNEKSMSSATKASANNHGRLLIMTQMISTPVERTRLEPGGDVELAMSHDSLQAARIALFGASGEGREQLVRVTGGMKNERYSHWVMLVGYPAKGPAERLAIGVIKKTDMYTWKWEDLVLG